MYLKKCYNNTVREGRDVRLQRRAPQHDFIHRRQIPASSSQPPSSRSSPQPQRQRRPSHPSHVRNASVPGRFMWRWPCSLVHSVCARQPWPFIGTKWRENAGVYLKPDYEDRLRQDLIREELQRRGKGHNTGDRLISHREAAHAQHFEPKNVYKSKKCNA